jgi:isopenicillin N synthase-like dioxygenase
MDRKEIGDPIIMCSRMGTCAFYLHASKRRLVQVANYPSQPLGPPSEVMRKRAHVDSGTLTILVGDDWLPGSPRDPRRGGLELQTAGGEWVEVRQG